MKRLILLAAIPLIIGCGAPSSLAPVSVPLEYRMMVDPLGITAVKSCAALTGIEVIDARDTATTIGKRYIEGVEDPAADLSTTSDVAAWVEEGLREILARSGASIGEEGAAFLRVRVERLDMIENVFRRAGYEARVALTAELIYESSGTVCWKASVEESAGNWGDIGSVENYLETVNHALDRASLKIVGSVEFEQAACGICER